MNLYNSDAFTGPLTVAATVGGDQAWLDKMWAYVVGPESGDGYFEHSLKLLSMIMITQNWWDPTTASCPK